PRRDFGRAEPARMHEVMPLSENRVELIVSERFAATDAVCGHARQNCRELERKGRNGMRQPRKRLRFEPFHVDFDEGRFAMALDQRMERGGRKADGRTPVLSFPTGRAMSGVYERLRTSCHGRIVDVEPEIERSGIAGHRERFDAYRTVAAVKKSQRLDQSW